MKKKALPDDLILNYLLGNLDKQESDDLEEKVRNDPELREIFFEIQASLESRILKLEDVPEEGGDIDFDRAKRGLFSKLELTEPARNESNMKVVEHQWNWIRWSVTAVAAALLITAVPSLYFMYQTNQGPATGGPAIVVYDIADSASADLNSIRSGENIREILYVDREQYDGLSRAETYAEQLWDEYLDRKEKNPDSIKGKGFVVYDLVGNQGFAGFYEPQEVSSTIVPSKKVETLWLAGDSVEEEVPIGSVNGEVGIFYFSLAKNKINISTLNEFIPLAKSDNSNGI